MFDKLKSIFSGDKKQIEGNKRIAGKLHDMPFKYVSEKYENGVETIIGRGGHINVEGEKGEYLCATCGINTIFKLEIAEMSIWEFMSLDGCVIDFTDVNTGKKRCVTVYYEKHLT